VAVARFAAWLAANRARRVGFIAAFFPLPVLGLFSAATVVMSVQLYGAKQALNDCLLALALLTGITLVTGGDALVLMMSAGVSWLLWMCLGGVVRTTGSLTLAVQAAVVMTLVGLGLMLTMLDDPVAYWSEFLQTLYAEYGIDVPAEIDEQAALMSGVVAAGSMTGALISLLLGSSWASAMGSGSYREQFRSLRLGYVLGGLAALTGVAELLGVQLAGLLLVFGAAFMFQGIAVVAWWSNRLRWPRGWWIGLCVLPILSPVFYIVVAMVYATIGFVDNWYGLRIARADD
jgi:hypothetical protein